MMSRRESGYFCANNLRIKTLNGTAWSIGNDSKVSANMNLTARSAVIFLSNHIMSNFKNTLDTQQKMNDAIAAIVKYFDQCSYSLCVESFANVQIQIMKMVKFLQHYDIGRRPSEQAFSEVDLDDVILFMMEVHEYLLLLKPFSNQSENEQ